MLRSILFFCMLLNGCGFRIVSIEPEITPKPLGDDYGKISARTFKLNDAGEEELAAFLAWRPMRLIFVEDPRAPLKIVEKVNRESSSDSVLGKTNFILAFATLTLLPAIETRSEVCRFEVQHCGMTFKTYEVKQKDLAIMWLPLLPFLAWFADDSLMASFGDFEENCETAFASEFFQDAKKNPWLTKACSAKP